MPSLPVSTLFIGLFALLQVPLTLMVGYRTASVLEFVLLESAILFAHCLVASRLMAPAWRGATGHHHAL